MRCLFIGGPLDGEVRDVPAERTIVEAPVPSSREVLLAASVPGKAKPLDYKRVSYRAERMCGPESEWTVFVQEGYSIDDALAMLLNGYRRQDDGPSVTGRKIER